MSDSLTRLAFLMFLLFSTPVGFHHQFTDPGIPASWKMVHSPVGTAVTLTFFGISFWLVPHLTRKPLYSNAMALWASWTWFVGMLVFALGMHWQGILAVPRRAHVSALPPGMEDVYADALVPQILTGISGTILLVSVVLYFWVLFGTVFARKTLADADVPEIPFVDAHAIRAEGVMRLFDRLGFWFLLAVALVALAYLPTLISLFLDQVPIPGAVVW